MGTRVPVVVTNFAEIRDPQVKQALQRIVQFMPPCLGTLAADPDTTAWGEESAGVCWWNTTARTYKHWDGTAVVVGL